jgi:protein SCO1/2
MTTRVALLPGLFLVFAAPFASALHAQEVTSPEARLLKQVDFDQNLNAQLPLETPLRDEDGRSVTLGDYFHQGRPVIVLFVYYECPMLCKLELESLVRNLKILTSMSPGKEFEIVTVSIDPRDTPEKAKNRKTGYLRRYERPGAEHGWHFLTGDATPVKQLANVAGFKYALDPRSGQYAHPAGLIVTTPEGKIARYIYGLEFPVSALRWSLIEASAGKIGSPIDKMLLMCFHYDPSTGRYNFAVMAVVRTLGVITFTCLATYMIVMLRRDRRKKPSETGVRPLGLGGLTPVSDGF